MLPEVEKFFAEYNNPEPLTEDEVREAVDAAYATFRSSIEVGHDNYAVREKFTNTVGNLTGGGRDARRALAWANLSQSDDKLIQYLIRQVISDYPEHVIEILPILPATLKELDVFAMNKGWCSEYDTIVSRAQRAGVLPQDGKADSSETRRELKDWFTDSYSGRRTNIRILFEFIDKIVTEETAAKEMVTETDTEIDA